MQCLKNLFLAFTLATYSPVLAIVPLHDSALGITQQRPYCPGRPASPAWQRQALYQFIDEIFFEKNGVTTSFGDFISPNYIQHNPFLLSGRNNTLAVLLGSDGSGIFSSANVTINKIMFDSPYGMVHYKYEIPGALPQAFVDMWRFDGTCIVEHWDVIQTLQLNATNPLSLVF